MSRQKNVLSSITNYIKVSLVIFFKKHRKFDATATSSLYHLIIKSGMNNENGERSLSIMLVYLASQYSPFKQ